MAVGRPRREVVRVITWTRSSINPSVHPSLAAWKEEEEGREEELLLLLLLLPSKAKNMATDGLLPGGGREGGTDGGGRGRGCKTTLPLATSTSISSLLQYQTLPPSGTNAYQISPLATPTILPSP